MPLSYITELEKQDARPEFCNPSWVTNNIATEHAASRTANISVRAFYKKI